MYGGAFDESGSSRRTHHRQRSEKAEHELVYFAVNLCGMP